MKENKLNFISVQDLVDGGVYMTHVKQLVQIKEIDKQKNQLHVYNISECCNVYMNLEKHSLVKRIR
jgi:hypothetical protein